MSGPEGEERLQGSRGERRFSALNPHGNVDFVLPSGGVSEYLGALSVPPAGRMREETAYPYICHTDRCSHESRELLVRPEFRCLLVGG